MSFKLGDRVVIQGEIVYVRSTGEVDIQTEHGVLYSMDPDEVFLVMSEDDDE